MALGKRVRQARTAAKLSQEELAALVRMTQGAITAMEIRDSDSSRKSLALATALKVSHHWLITGQESTEKQSSIFQPVTDLSFQIIQVLGTIEMMDSKAQNISVKHIAAPTHGVPVLFATAKTRVYQIVGSVMQRPFRDGWLVSCDPTRQPTKGEYLLIEHTDGVWSIGEYLFDRPNSIEIDSLNELGRISIQRSCISKLYPITAIIAPSQSQPL